MTALRRADARFHEICWLSGPRPSRFNAASRPQGATVGGVDDDGRLFVRVLVGRGRVPVSGRAMFASRCSVFLRLVVTAVIVMVRGLTMVVRGRFMVRRRRMVVAARRMRRFCHEFLLDKARLCAGGSNGVRPLEFHLALNNVP